MRPHTDSTRWKGRECISTSPKKTLSSALNGDLAELSETDIRLVAAAFELDCPLVTDDYAMQNVAEKLDVTVEVIARDGISEQREWQFQCAGCGREFDENHDRCPVYGSSLSRKNPA